MYFERKILKILNSEKALCCL